jgi:hypothetical protein
MAVILALLRVMAYKGDYPIGDYPINEVGDEETPTFGCQAITYGIRVGVALFAGVCQGKVG